MFAHQLAYLEKKHPGQLELYYELLRNKEAWSKLMQNATFMKVMQLNPSDESFRSVMETIAKCLDRVVCSQEILLLNSIRLDFYESMLSTQVSSTDEDTRG